MGITRRTFGTALASLYFAAGLLVLWDFWSAPPDGLANVPLALHVAPVTALGLLLTKLTGLQFPFVAASLGYYGSHTVYFMIAMPLTALLLRRLAGGPAPKKASVQVNQS